MPYGPASPPQVPKRLETGQGALTCFDRLVQPTREQVDLGQARFGKRSDFLQTGRSCDRHRVLAMVGGHIGATPGQGMKEPAPVVPSRAPARIFALVDELAD